MPRDRLHFSSASRHVVSDAKLKEEIRLKKLLGVHSESGTDTSDLLREVNKDSKVIRCIRSRHVTTVRKFLFKHIRVISTYPNTFFQENKCINK